MFNVREFDRHPGEERKYERAVPAPADLGLELIRVPAESTLDLNLRFEAVREGVYVSGTVSGELHGECGRCLDPLTSQINVHLRELYAFPDSHTGETTTEEEVSRVDGDLVDVEPALRDAVVLALPANPVCDPDCGGLCSGCGDRWDDLPDDHSHEQIDPRWKALRDLAGQSPPKAE